MALDGSVIHCSCHSCTKAQSCSEVPYSLLTQHPKKTGDSFRSLKRSGPLDYRKISSPFPMRCNMESNLLKLRRSGLGSSAPSIPITKEIHLSRTQKCGQRGIPKRSIITTSPTMPRAHSPLSHGSPLDSPKTPLPFQHFVFGTLKKERRWSVASLPSSGYGTTPASSNVSSQCSSQERLHQISTGGGAAGEETPNWPSSSCLGAPTTQTPVHFSSNDSNPSLDEDGGRVGYTRPRSRSLSSPIRSPVMDNEIIMMNTLYKERFPKATKQMEDRLKEFNQANGNFSIEDSDGVVRFVHRQIIELARDCLSKSEESMITSRYFHELSEKLEHLVEETREKSEPEAMQYISSLTRKFLLIVSRPARLLECLEFNPDEFYQLLEQAEGQAKASIMTDIPQYIVHKLGLHRNPLEELEEELKVTTIGIPFYSSTPVKESGADKDSCSEKKVKAPSENDYDMKKLISNGAYGAVYLVRHKETNERFAMKKINKYNLLLRNQVDQVFAERDIMSFTDNPFVVSMFCSFETKKHVCLVMEYVEGGDCATLLKSMGPLPLDMTRFYFAETVLAVEYLHSYGIVHRDLKPDNLLITAMGHIKLTDFGLSKMGLMSLATNLYEGMLDREARQFSDKQVFGTPEYIAPEVILRQGYGKPVDWWSMGVILYEFLLGCVPFFGDTPEELFAHTVSAKIEWPPDDDALSVDLEAKSLITACLQINPMDRIGTGGAHELRDHPFFDCLDWDSLLRQKAEFVPVLENEEDTSYFDTRAERYSHDIEDDTDDADESSMWSFSSCSPRYKRWSRFELDHQADSPGGQASNSSGSNTTDQETISKDYHRLKKVLSTPDSSQTESEDVSPVVRRRQRRINTGHEVIPRFSISTDTDTSSVSTPELHRELSPVDESDRSEGGIPKPPAVPPQLRSVSPMTPQRPVIKSASTTGLSLVIPKEDLASPLPVQSPGGSSTASSRDGSPNRDLSPLTYTLKPPIVIRRCPRGFGFFLKPIRVYYGESDLYTYHHIVSKVEEGSPAFEAGLRPGELITHVNGELVEGLLHPQLMTLMLSGGDQLTLRATPLDATSIRTGARRRSTGKFARRHGRHHRKSKKEATSRPRKPSLIRRLSSKRNNNEIQQDVNGKMFSPSDGSSGSSSPTTSAPNSPASAQYPRPSSLHGLQHRLHNVARNLHSPSRRRSVGCVPVSPLARTPSPSRSPSPLALPMHAGAGLSLSTSKKTYTRPKSAEPGSPLLRRALSPDRAHSRPGIREGSKGSPHNKTKHGTTPLSPLVQSSPPRVTVTAQSPPDRQVHTVRVQNLPRPQRIEVGQPSTVTLSSDTANRVRTSMPRPASEDLPRSASARLSRSNFSFPGARVARASSPRNIESPIRWERSPSPQNCDNATDPQSAKRSAQEKREIFKTGQK